MFINFIGYLLQNLQGRKELMRNVNPQAINRMGKSHIELMTTINQHVINHMGKSHSELMTKVNPQAINHMGKSHTAVKIWVSLQHPIGHAI